MSGVIEKLISNKDSSEAKSYLIGLERGRAWAQDYADYYEMREWSEIEVEELDELALPPDEKEFFKVIRAETPLHWRPYLRGWVQGVKEILQEY